MINSVCLCITFQCDLCCRHCFVEAGPHRQERMTTEQIAIAIDNSYPELNRMWFSGGEPTIDMDSLLFGLRYAKEKQLKYGYPRNICVQTNGNFADNEQKAFKFLLDFYRNGANEIDITSNDSFHKEQMDMNRPHMIARIANKMGVFSSVSIGGSEYKVVKKFGRAKHISNKELSKFKMNYISKCVLTESDLVVHPNGNVLPCIYGFDNILGNIYYNNIETLLKDDSNISIMSSLRNGDIRDEILATQLAYEDLDICDICNKIMHKIKTKECQPCSSKP